MILDNPPDQVAWRFAFLSGKHLDLLEDHLRKFHGSLHDNHCPMSDTLGSDSACLPRPRAARETLERGLGECSSGISGAAGFARQTLVYQHL